MPTINYTVIGMTCAHCVQAVTEEVSSIAGVTDVSVSLDDGHLAVTSAADIPFAAVSEAVDEAGDYSVAAR